MDNYINTFQLENTVIITLKQMDKIKSIAKNKDVLVSDLYKELGFKRKDYALVSKILSDWSEKLEKDNSESKAIPPSRKSVGSGLSNFISKLNSTQICLCLANFDIIKALHIYNTIDFRQVHESFNLWVEFRMVELGVDFEVAVVAAGGSLSGGKGGNTTRSKDLPKDAVISFN